MIIKVDDTKKEEADDVKFVVEKEIGIEEYFKWQETKLAELETKSKRLGKIASGLYKFINKEIEVRSLASEQNKKTCEELEQKVAEIREVQQRIAQYQRDEVKHLGDLNDATDSKAVAAMIMSIVAILICIITLILVLKASA